MLLASDMTGEGGTAELLDFGVCRPRSDTLGEAASMRSLRRSISFRLLLLTCVGGVECGQIRTPANPTKAGKVAVIIHSYCVALRGRGASRACAR